MFTLIKQVFIALLSFGRSLATKYASLNNEPFFIDLNSVGLKYSPFMISLNKCSGNCNSRHKCFIVFNMKTNKNKAKAMVKHILYDCKCKFNSSTCN